MLLGLYIIVDDDFDTPVYAGPETADLDDATWSAGCECVNEALEGERDPRGSEDLGEVIVAWRTQRKEGLSFVAFGSAIRPKDLEAYLRMISERYVDEVDDPRNPDRVGVEDVLVDVIPPWEDDD